MQSGCSELTAPAIKLKNGARKLQSAPYYLANMKRYKEIKTCLRSPTMRAEITFVVESARLFEKFSKCFQRREPMIHVLYAEVKDLVVILAGRVCKKGAVDQLFSLDNPLSSQNLLLTKEVKCGDLTEKELSEKKPKEIETLKFRKSVQDFFVASAKYLLDKSILNTSLARHFRFLNPLFVKNEKSLMSAEKVAQALPVDISVTEFIDEWKLLQREELPRFVDGERIDHFWREVFKIRDSLNEKKFPNVMKIVKPALSVSHGSADVERGFSESCNVLTDKKTRMNERTLNAKFNIRSGLAFFCNKPELVPMTKDLMLSARFAYGKYRDYLEEEKKKKEVTLKRKRDAEDEVKRREEVVNMQKNMRKDIVDLENQVKKLKKTEVDEIKASDVLLSDGQKKLETALKNNDLTGARVAYGMISGAQDIRKKVQETGVSLGSLRDTLQKKQSSLITSFFKSTEKSLVPEKISGSNLD